MTRYDIRDAKLNGTRAASEAHTKLGIKAKIREGTLDPIDVFDALQSLDITTICRPLDGLLGAYMNTSSGPGVLVTTNRRLPIQRFTAAHELGHCWLEHDESLDSEESIARAHSGQIQQVPLQEIEAEAFASEFLLPKSLIIKTAKRCNWSKKDLALPQNVYQLSLRACVSYEATWRALLEHNLINNLSAKHLHETPPKVSKHALAPKEILDNPWADVLLLTKTDHESTLLIGPEDTIIISLEEHTTSGYVWDSLAERPNIRLLDDLHLTNSTENLGSICNRKVFFRGSGKVELDLEEKRPWELKSPALNTLKVHINCDGQEQGLPRVARK